MSSDGKTRSTDGTVEGTYVTYPGGTDQFYVFSGDPCSSKVVKPFTVSFTALRPCQVRIFNVDPARVWHATLDDVTVPIVPSAAQIVTIPVASAGAHVLTLS